MFNGKCLSSLSSICGFKEGHRLTGRWVRRWVSRARVRLITTLYPRKKGLYYSSGKDEPRSSRDRRDTTCRGTLTMKMSKEVKVALIGAAATVVAAIIAGIFLKPTPPPPAGSSTPTIGTPPPAPSISSAHPENITLTCLSGPCLPTITVFLYSLGRGS